MLSPAIAELRKSSRINEEHLLIFYTIITGANVAVKAPKLNNKNNFDTHTEAPKIVKMWQTFFSKCCPSYCISCERNDILIKSKDSSSTELPTNHQELLLKYPTTHNLLLKRLL